MSTSVTFNGSSYTVPAIADASWGTNVSNYLIAIASGCLQKTGGSFTLSAADVDFGATYGLKAVYFKSKTANIAAAGVVQLAKTDVISWRNNANGADLALGITAGDVLTFNSIPFLYLALGSAYTVLQMNSGGTAYTWATPAGTGAPVLATSPTLVTPVLGVATATSINKMAITAPATSSTLAVADGKTATISNTLTLAGTDGNTMTFPSGSSTVVTLASLAASGTAKDVDFGTASNTSRLTLPKASTSTLSGLTRKQGTVVYDSTLNQVFSDDGTNLNPVGSGAGEKNYISTGSNNAGGWTASGVGVTVATDTTAADLPRSITTKSGILISRASGSTAYGYYRFTLDPADYNKKLKIAFAMKPGGSYVASDFKVDMYSNTASDYSGTSTRLTLSTDSSSISALPNATLVYQTTFDAPSSTATFMELRVGLNASTSGTAIAISDVIVGPGIQPQGGAISPSVTYTPTFSAGFGTVSATTVYYTRRGDCVGVIGTTTAGTVAGSAATMTLPNSWTALATQICGRWTRVNATGTTRKAGTLFSTASSNSIGFGSDDYTTAAGPTTSANGSSLFANSDVIYVEIIDLPIADLAGSGTINIVQNDVEYAASTTGTWDAAAAAANTIYGPAGAPISGSLAAARSKVVQFTTPIQQTDKIFLEFLYNGTGASVWVEAANSFYPAVNWPGVSFGANIAQTSATQMTVTFNQFGGAGTTYNSTTGAQNWSSGNYSAWRLRKAASGQAVGFGKATDGSLGLVNTYTSTTATTFSFNGSGGTSASATVRYQRLGDFVTLFWPDITATTGTSSTTFTSNTAIDSWARPLTASQSANIAIVNNNAAVVAQPGRVLVTTGGILTLTRDAVSTAFTNSATAGVNAAFTFTYYVGTGS